MRLPHLCFKFNIGAVLLALYTSVVWVIYIFINYVDDFFLLGFIGVGLSLILYLIFALIFNASEKLVLHPNPIVKKRTKIILFIFAALVCLTISMLWYWAYYPGSFSYDSFNQYNQVKSGVYNDWHPAIHTLIFFTVPVKITGSLASVVLFQLIYFSLLLGYIFESVSEYIGIKQAMFAFLYIILNPYVSQIMLYPWKDVGFAIAGTFCATMLFRIFYSNGHWAEKNCRVFLLGVILGITTLLRHNAVLLTLPMVIFAFCIVKRKQWIKLAIVLLATVVLIKEPLYGALNVSKPGNRVVETMGLPLTVIANVAKENPEAMDGELSDYIYNIVSQQNLEKYYNCGDYNSIKFSSFVDHDIVEKKGRLYALKMMGKSIVYSPKSAMKSFFCLTDIVYGFSTGRDGKVRYNIMENAEGVGYSGNRSLKVFFDTYANFCDSSKLIYLRTYGVLLWLLLFALCLKMEWFSAKSYRRLLFVLPIFIYDFGTMLFLMGAESRFFFVTFLVFPLYILASVYPPNA